MLSDVSQQLGMFEYALLELFSPALLNFCLSCSMDLDGVAGTV